MTHPERHSPAYRPAPSWYRDLDDLFEYLMMFNDENFCCEDDRDEFLFDKIRKYNRQEGTEFPVEYNTLLEFRLFNEKHAVTK